MNAIEQVRKSQAALARQQGGDTSIGEPDVSLLPGYPTCEPALGEPWEEARVEQNGQGSNLSQFVLASYF